jgi:hypothetical protein
MPRKAIGDVPLTQAERQARQRARKASERILYRDALECICFAKTIREAREIALNALDKKGMQNVE